MVRVWVAGKTVWSPCYTHLPNSPNQTHKTEFDQTQLKLWINTTSFRPTEYIYIFVHQIMVASKKRNIEIRNSILYCVFPPVVKVQN